MTKNHAATLYMLGDRGKTVDGSANDVRGRQVKDENVDGIGKVADLLVDDRPYHSGVYTDYGYWPYWSEDYKYPTGLAMLPASLPTSPLRTRS